MAAPNSSSVPLSVQPDAISVESLVQSIKKSLPKGWKVEYDKKKLLLWVKRNRPVRTIIYGASFGFRTQIEPATDAMLRFEFAFQCSPYISPDSWRQFELENEITRQKLKEQENILRELNVKTTKAVVRYLPKNDEEKTLVERYKKLGDSLHYFPEYRFQWMSLDWSPVPYVYREWYHEHYYNMVIDEPRRLECKRVMEVVLGLLTRYEKSTSS